MKNLHLLLSLSSLALFGTIRAQVQNNAGGDYWLKTTSPAPRSFLIGNNTMPFPFESILNMRGDWMTNLTLGLRGEVFRTRGGWFTDQNDAFGLATHWRMLRAVGPLDDDRIEIGEISCNFGLTADVYENRGFNVIAKRFGGSVWLRNRRGRPNYDAPVDEAANDEALGNGLRLIDDSSSVGGGLPLNGYTRIPRLGYVGFGHTRNMDQVANAGDMIMPWTRLHAVHGAGYPTYATEVPESAPYRPYCRNGLSFSGNSTYAYIGHKYSMPNYPESDAEVTDSTDVLALWGNDKLLFGNSHWNNFSFRFTLAPDGTLGSASDYEGLEIMRLRPDQREEGGRVEGFVGIGDWVNNFPEVPEERLDVRDRTIRIRSMGLPGQYNNDALNRVLVVDPADGRVYWRDASTIGSGGGSGCNWAYVPSANRMYTAFDPVGAGSCPQKDWLLGIGESVPKTKLDVYTERTTGGATGAIRGIMKANTDATVQSGIVGSVSPETSGNTVQTGIGIDGSATDVNKGYGARGTVNLTLSGASTTDAFGTFGYANAADGSADYVVGARGEVTVTGTTVGRRVVGTYGLVKTPLTSGSVTNSFGMFGLSDAYGNIANNYGGYGGSSSNTGITLTNSYGLFGSSGGHGTITNSYGVYGTAGAGTNNFSVYGAFNGNGANDWTGFFPGRTFTPGGLWTMSDPEFKTNITPLEENDQDPVHRLMQLNVHAYSFNVDAYPYLGLPLGQHFGFLAPDLAEQFPDMVADATFPAQHDSTGAEITPAVPFKTVNTTDLLPLAIAALQRQEARIAQLEEIVAGCCSNGDHRDLHYPSNGGSSALETDLRIIPNPVDDRTELRYTLAETGRVRLEVTDGTGRIIMSREEGVRERASYVYEWDTTLLAPGTYQCALYVNDEPLVKKAVKLNAR